MKGKKTGNLYRSAVFILRTRRGSAIASILLSSRRCGKQHLVPILLPFLLWGTFGQQLGAQHADYLADRSPSFSMTHQQQWGQLGLNVAASMPGKAGSPLRIGKEMFTRGLGHHANGEIVIDLRGQFSQFCASVGVQWQGGGKGSVVFRVVVDEKTVFQCGPMSDTDPAKNVQIPVQDARQLRLIASDGDDGIGCDMANWADAHLVRNPDVPCFGPLTASFNGRAAPPSSASVCGLSVIAGDTGPQVVVLEPVKEFTVSVGLNEEVRLVIPAGNFTAPTQIAADVSITGGSRAEVELAFGAERVCREVQRGESITLATEFADSGDDCEITVAARGIGDATGVRWRRLHCRQEGRTFDIPLAFPKQIEQFPPRPLPNPRPSIQQAMIEWDWRMQDGIGTRRESRTWTAAIQKVFERGDCLIQDLAASGVHLDRLADPWEELRSQWKALSADQAASPSRWEDLWRRVHVLRRRIVFQNPLADVGPLVFVKRVPGCFSHQLTQYYGTCSRPGGSIFALDAPGHSMHCRRLAALPTGSYQHPEVSWDGHRILFAFCRADSSPANWRTEKDRFYHLFEMDADGSNLRQLTEGPYDDFSPRYLPDGKILFLSTRRGGFHRCGRGPCPVYTMAVANADGSDPRVISYHETHEWDPAVLNDGRVIYTRWDYVDRHAVHYQQLWTVRPDGSDVRAFYGNNTFNPVGVWEARPVPGSSLVMATAGAHHAMTAGSIILLDVTRGIDGLKPITRLTPDALFPESEFRVDRWHAPAGVSVPPSVPAEERRWPGHCYRAPFPLSKDYFLACYSFAPLTGEPDANRANMFGIYLVDRFGNKELLYRDPNIGSLWPTPLRPRPRPPAIPSILDETSEGEGTFLVQNVNESWPKLPTGPEDAIKRLRILQVLPKTTPYANTPRVGLANASPGKQVLGTVPVERDGSAYFRAPAGIPLSFQALDARGMAVQTMRSLTYLQPGEQSACIGCHEHRTRAPDLRSPALARQREPSVIRPGPDGSRPFSYPVLVQPVLDRHCVTCHGDAKAEGGIDLTGAPAGSYTASYNALAPRVPFSEWKSTPQANSEPLARPERFGARASPLMAMLLKGHEGVTLTQDDLERLATWMDANALFYGTFDPQDQRRQQQGERIAGPALE